MYRCERCGEIFDEPEINISTWYEEAWGVPVKMEYGTKCCPFCGIEDEFEPYCEEEEDEYAQAV